MKKTLLLISLITALSSCGGGGGGGSSQTSGTTPIAPTSENTNNGSGNTNISSENTNTGFNNTNTNSGNPNEINNINNNVQAIQPQNIVPGTTSQTPTADNRFPKPVDSREITGQGVKVGVLDSDFLSKDAETKGFHTRRDYEGFFKSDTFAQVINEEFGDRLIAINKTLGPNSILNESDHGLIVATILAGKNGNGAKGASIYGVSFGERSKSIVLDKSKYEELYNNGVRIFNQSFGTPNNFAEEDDNFRNAKSILIHSTLREKEIEASILEKRLNEIHDFYRMAVQDGALFIWAAGNTTLLEGGRRITYNVPTLQAGLPTYIPELHKGWIAVIGVKPDV